MKKTTTFSKLEKKTWKAHNIHTTNWRCFADGPLENVVRQRKNKALSRGRRDKRGTSETAEEDGFQEAELAHDNSEEDQAARDILEAEHNDRWKRILLLIVAVTVHNIPEGLAVGVAFGSIGKASTATFESARNLAIGIGIQNFPEGLAVSLPLKTAGFSAAKSIWCVFPDFFKNKYFICFTSQVRPT